MNELANRLSSLADHLDVGDDDSEAGDRLVNAVLARLDEPDVHRSSRRSVVVAAAIVAAVSLAVAVPSSRRTVASWFGFDSVHIEVDPDLSVPERPPTISSLGDAELPSPGMSSSIVVNGVAVIVSSIDGTLDQGVITKTVGLESPVQGVDVGGKLGIWIDGAAHEVAYRDGDGDLVFERFAGNTLLWQDGTTLHRVEGFATIDEALAFATRRAP